MTCGRFRLVSIVGTLLALLQCTPAVAQVADPHKLLTEADRLAWLRVWTRAEPLFAKAREAFIASGDERNALYAEVSRLRGQFTTLDFPRPVCTGERAHALRTSSFCKNGVHAVGMVRSCNMNQVAKCGADGWRRKRIAVSWRSRSRLRSLTGKEPWRPPAGTAESSWWVMCCASTRRSRS